MNKDIRPDKTSPAYLKKTKSGGLFVGFLYVLLFMSILGLGIWQSFESSYTDAKIKTNEDRLAIIEEQMNIADEVNNDSLTDISCLLYTSPSPRDKRQSRMPSSA